MCSAVLNSIRISVEGGYLNTLGFSWPSSSYVLLNKINEKRQLWLLSEDFIKMDQQEGKEKTSDWLIDKHTKAANFIWFYSYAFGWFQLTKTIALTNWILKCVKGKKQKTKKKTSAVCWPEK